MEREVKLGQREAVLVLSKRVPVRLSEIGTTFSAAFGEIYGHLQAAAVEPNGPPFVIYHGSPEVEDPFEVEICAPVVQAVDPPAGWRMQRLPAGTFVTLLHVGSYETLGVAYDALEAWIQDHDLVAAGPPREVYLSEASTPPEQVKTIIELPVSGAAAPVATG